jgi:hypothetical protein
MSTKISTSKNSQNSEILKNPNNTASTKPKINWFNDGTEEMTPSKTNANIFNRKIRIFEKSNHKINVDESEDLDWNKCVKHISYNNPIKQ